MLLYRTHPDALVPFSGVNDSPKIAVATPSINVDHPRVCKITASNVQNPNAKIPTEKHDVHS